MTQAERVLDYIRTHPDCTMLDLTYGLFPFVSNPRARISDLRAAGHVIEASGRPARYRVVEPAVQLAAFG
jgi:hypothetical protein